MKPNPTSFQLFFQAWARRQPRTLLLGLLIGLLTLVSSGCALPIRGIINAQEGLTPTRPTTPIIAVAPDFGTPGTVIAIAGAGWQPTDVITLKLASATEPGALEESITVVTVAEDGTFTGSITFPEAERWRVFPTVLVIAESAQTNVRATAPFELLAVGVTVTTTVTPTVMAEEEPTATPTTSAPTGPTATWTPLPTIPAPSATATRVPATATPIVLGQNQVYVTSNGLNMRSGPDVAYAIVRAVRYGTVLNVLGQSSGGGWLQVQLADGTTGWVSRYYTSGAVNPPVVQPTAPAPTSTSQPTVAITNWRGEYYANRDLSGTPLLVRNDDRLDFNWFSGSPAVGIPSNGFSVRWSRAPYFDSGRYRFHVRVDDGVRLYVDNSLVIDQWNEGSERDFTADRNLSSGNHTIRVEYFENTGNARIAVWWERIGSISDNEFPDWKGEYFSNRTLSGSPTVVRNDNTIDFNWGSGSPAAGIPSNDFSARWTRSPYFDSGRYRFHVRVDDGVRLYVDDSLLIDQWNEGSDREFTADRDLSSGNHAIRVEYFENTGGARITVWWERIGGTSDDDDEFPDWKGEYFTNRNLEGDPRFRRNDEEIDFNWRDGSPDSRIPDDNFSVRWTQRVRFDRGRYRFEFRADDGIRFYIDGNRVLNEWHENEYSNSYELEFDLEGRHNLTVEYYERRGGARVYVDWDRIGDIVTATPTPLPTNTPIAPTNTPVSPTPTNTPVTPTNTPGPTNTPTLTPTVVQPSANIQPNAGGPGTTITVNGGGFAANTTVNIHLGALVGIRSSALEPESYATTTTDRTGSYSVAFALPATWPDGTAITDGQLMVMAATEDFAQQATALLNYTAVAPAPTATATETPTAEPTATGIQPATPTATNTPLPTATPAVTATPVPQPFVTLDPSSATPGTLIRVSGGGFPANTPLGLYLGIFDGEISPNDAAVTFASTISDSAGNYTMSFVMPEDTPTGVLLQSGRIALIVATDDFALQASATLDFTGAEPTPGPTATAVAAAGQNSEDIANGTIPPLEGAANDTQ